MRHVKFVALALAIAAVLVTGAFVMAWADPVGWEAWRVALFSAPGFLALGFVVAALAVYAPWDD